MFTIKLSYNAAILCLAYTFKVLYSPTQTLEQLAIIFTGRKKDQKILSNQRMGVSVVYAQSIFYSVTERN